VRYTLPRHKRGDWVGTGRSRKSTRPGRSGVFELTPLEFLNRLAVPIPPPRRPPVDWGEPSQFHGDETVAQRSPADLPMIDIHHR